MGIPGEGKIVMDVVEETTIAKLHVAAEEASTLLAMTIMEASILIEEAFMGV